MSIVNTLLIKTLSGDTGTQNVQNSLSGGGSVSFTIDIQTVTNGEYQQTLTNYLQANYDVDPNRFIFFIYDTQITGYTPTDISNYFQTFITKFDTVKYDTIGVNVFLDQCSQYTDTMTITSPSGGITLSRTTGSRGVGALLFSPNGVKKYLADAKKYQSLNETLFNAVHDGILISYSLSPGLYNYNPKNATFNSDYIRCSQCTNVKSTVTSGTNLTPVQFLIFIVIAILILVLVFSLFWVSPSYGVGVPNGNTPHFEYNPQSGNYIQIRR